MTKTDPKQNRAEEWKDAAFSLACEKGFAAVSTRAVAELAGGSASAVSYYFGTRDVLVEEICRRATEASTRCRERSTQELSGLPGWSDLPAAFVSTLQWRLEHGRTVLTLLREMEQDALADDGAHIRSALTAEAALEIDHWRNLAALFGASASQADLWADLGLGLTSLLLSEGSSARRSAWITLPAYRLYDRLMSRPVRLIDYRGIDAADLALKLPANETAARILEAALEEIAQYGANNLNLRGVAARANTSLSSVTYFFGSKQELVTLAFRELCRRQCSLIVDEDAPPFSREELIRMLSGADVVRDSTVFEALLCAAVRHQDYVEVVNFIRHTRGVGSVINLRKMGFNIDRLDSFLWISIVSGRFRRIQGRPRQEWPCLLHSAAESAIPMIFGQENGQTRGQREETF